MHSKVKLLRAKFGKKPLKTENKRYAFFKWKSKKPTVYRSAYEVSTYFKGLNTLRIIILSHQR